MLRGPLSGRGDIRTPSGVPLPAEHGILNHHITQGAHAVGGSSHGLVQDPVCEVPAVHHARSTRDVGHHVADTVADTLQVQVVGVHPAIVMVFVDGPGPGVVFVWNDLAPISDIPSSRMRVASSSIGKNNRASMSSLLSDVDAGFK